MNFMREVNLKRYTYPALITIFLTALLAACVPPSPTPTASFGKWVDDLGREVQLEEPPERIISLAPSHTEILYAVGAGAQMVGRDEFSNYPEEVLVLTSVGGSMGDYNLDQIVALTPDLVLAAEIVSLPLVKDLEELDITVYYLKNPIDVEGVFGLLTTVGALTGHTAEAEALAEVLNTRVDSVKKKVEGVESRPKVFYELDGSDPAKPWTAGSGTYIDQLIQLAGGENVAASMQGNWGQFSQEALLQANPDFILLGDAAYGITAEMVASRPGWDSIEAVKTGKVLPFNDDTVSRPGPRLVDALEELVRLLHPEVQ